MNQSKLPGEMIILNPYPLLWVTCQTSGEDADFKARLTSVPAGRDVASCLAELFFCSWSVSLKYGKVADQKGIYIGLHIKLTHYF